MHHGAGGAPQGGTAHLPNQLSVVTTVNYGTHPAQIQQTNHNMDPSSQSQMMVRV